MNWFRLFLILLNLLNICGCQFFEQPPAKISSRMKVDKFLLAKKFNKSSYIVQKGDTLYSIAWQNNLDFRYLAYINNIKPPYAIYPGNIIKLYKGKHKHVSTINHRAKFDAHKTRESINNIISNNSSNWIWPSNGIKIQGFSGGNHDNEELKFNGIDLKNKEGTPILAAATGEVVYSGNALKGYGNLIIIKHANNFLSAYAHNRRNLINEGDKVVIGQKIAEMGCTGTDQVMLHFEIRYKGKPIDPEKILPKKK